MRKNKEAVDAFSKCEHDHMCGYVIPDTYTHTFLYHLHLCTYLYSKKVVMDLLQQVIIFMDTAYYREP